MKEIIKRGLQRGLNPPNILCWLTQKADLITGATLGYMTLWCKARLLGISLGKNVKAHGKIVLLRWPGGKIVIEDNVSLASGVWRATACAPAFPLRLRVFGPGAEINIGAGSELTAVSITARSRSINIGKFVLIAPNCIIVDSDFHSHWPCETRAQNPGYENDAPVEIGDYAWIGMNSIILKGVRIGRGAIIGAGSVVNRDVPDYSVACGNPARVIATHNPENQA